MAAILGALAVAGCASGNVKTTLSTPSGKTLILSADNRAILFAKKRVGTEQRCAEPQPDAIRAVAQELSAALKAGFPISGVPVDVAASVAAATREAVGELGKRTPTIQLLRDLLFNACLAGMNDTIRPKDKFDLHYWKVDKNGNGMLVTIPYGFDQLAVDVIKQMDNMTLALHAIDGITGMGNVGKVTISATASTNTSAEAGDATKGTAGATTLTSSVSGDGRAELPPESAKAIADALVKIVTVSLTDDGNFAR
ncbi:MAG: hypothetical protein AAF503_03065 [Pseudomonadota bacterium]